MSSSSEADHIYDTLTGGLEARKADALRAFNGHEQRVNQDYLRQRIVTALTIGDFKPGNGAAEQDQVYITTRGWLLNALGRLSAHDPEAERFALEHLDPQQEPHYLVRYKILEGLIASGIPKLDEVARDTEKRETGPDGSRVVYMLAVVWLASHGHHERLEEVLTALRSPDFESQWSALWALGSVPIEATVDDLCDLISRADESHSRHLSVYRAIVALGSHAGTYGARNKRKAASTLVEFIRDRRGWPVWDEARTRALTALGGLRDESLAPALIEELTDDNPAVVREAALALEKVVGIRTATDRVVEAACKLDEAYAGVTATRRSYIWAFANALRWMDYTSVVEELEGVMVSGAPGKQEAARALLSEIGGLAAFQKLQARRKVMDKYTTAMDEAEGKIRELFDTSIREARHGFTVAIGMDVVVFLLGVVLLGASAALAYTNDGNLDNWAGVGLTGGVGLLGILYGTLIAEPRKKVQQAVDHLMYLKIVFLAYLRQLHQADQAYARHLLEDETSMTPEDVKEFSVMVDQTMRNAVRTLTEQRQGANNIVSDNILKSNDDR